MGRYIKVLRSDNNVEYTTNEFTKLDKTSNFSNAYVSQQNGASEHMN